MALRLSIYHPLTAVSAASFTACQPKPSVQFQLPISSNYSPFNHGLVIANAKTRSRVVAATALEENRESTETEAVNEEVESMGNESGESSVEVSELGAEIKRAMMERKEKEEGDLLSGVSEEVREIEWPAFRKVLGTTGVVLAVIAGSSVVLLTVNAVLAELSDRVFAGRGVQDFFS